MFFSVTHRISTVQKRCFNSQIVIALGGLQRIHDGENLERALQAVERLDLQGKPLPKELVYCILQGCTIQKDLSTARGMRSLMVKQGLAKISFFADHLIRIFALCGCLSEAEEVFHMVGQPTVYTWNAIISAHANLSSSKGALELYHAMQGASVKPSKITFLSILKACASLAREGLGQGKLIHNQITTSGLSGDEMIGNALVDMYAKCGNLEQAQEMFDALAYRTVVSYGALIAGYAQHGFSHISFEYFEKMQKECVKPNRVIFLCLMKACTKANALDQAIQIHDHINKNGLLSDVVIGTALVDMYVKCESIARAFLVFDTLPRKNIISWGAMIGGFVQHGDSHSALVCFGKMQQDGIQPDRAVFLAVLRVCASNGSRIRGRIIHHQIVKNKLEGDLSVGNTLVDMYAKCGSFDDAQRVFSKLLFQDIVSWAALVTGYALNGQFNAAWECVIEMQQAGVSPTEIVFTSILAGCSNAGLAKEGYEFFNAMVVEYGITPTAAHYNCMVDLLGRTGCLEEALKLLQSMPIDPSVVAWRSLLAGCKTYGNKALGKLCFEEVSRLDPTGASSFSIMSKLYGDADMWEDFTNLQDLKRTKAVWKKPGRAFIEIDNNMHEFTVGERPMEQIDPMAMNMKRLGQRILKEGYVPELSVME